MILSLRRAIRESRQKRRGYKIKARKPRPTTPPLEIKEEDGNELIICSCGGAVKYAGVHVCEECFVTNHVRWPGKATRAGINY